MSPSLKFKDSRTKDNGTTCITLRIFFMRATGNEGIAQLLAIGIDIIYKSNGASSTRCIVLKGR